MPEEETSLKLAFWGEGSVHNNLKMVLSHSDRLDEANLIVCIPDEKDLRASYAALAALKDGQSLLTGIARGSTLFLLPLVVDRRARLSDMYHRLLATERGIGNAYLSESLCTSEYDDGRYPPEESVTRWISADIAHLTRRERLSGDVARIYRGTSCLREDIVFEDTAFSVSQLRSVSDIVFALERSFVGAGRIIGSTELLPQISLNDSMKMVVSYGARPRQYCQTNSEAMEAWGKGATLAEAKIASLMESIERYVTGGYDLSSHPLLSERELDSPVLPRFAYTGYGPDDDAPDAPPVTEQRRWHKVTSYFSQRTFYVPLEAVCFPVVPLEAGYMPVDGSNSSGVAAHFSRDMAVAAACHELLERDAYMIAWLRRAQPPRVDLLSLPETIRKTVLSMQERGWFVSIINLSSSLSYIYAVLVWRDTLSHRYAIGAASADGAELACSKAVLEAQLATALAEESVQVVPDKPYDLMQMPLVGTPVNHIQLYETGRHDALIKHMFVGSTVCDFGTPSNFSDNITIRLREAGYEVYVADLACPRVNKMTSDIHVVRAFIPSLVPMVFGRSWRRTGSPRIDILPKQLGWHMPQDAQGYETFPHPFH
ncbi:MAG: YcaO-like family protein [Alphaproteobacteria bacterium]|nr:YcaO-like family protein [Alphaproteobacteria bacterium]